MPKINTTLVQTRVDDESIKWLMERAAQSGGVSIAEELRRVIREAMATQHAALDYSALESRLLERIRKLEIEVFGS